MLVKKMDTEVTPIFYDIPRYKGLYQISKCGQVKSLINGIILKQANTLGYRMVRLFDGNGGSKCKKVHRLVMLTFEPNTCNMPQVNHKDGNKSNNDLSNLEWCTASFNVKHAFDTGLKTASLTGKGRFNELSLKSKKIVQLTKDGEEVKRFPSLSQAKRDLGYNICSISDCLTGRQKTAYGFRWAYAS